MSKKKVTEIVSEMLEPFLRENGYELFNIEYIKEGKDWFLRIFIDSESGIGIDDCEKVSVYISARLDEADPIDKNYYLEVSSPGIDRPLIKDSDYEKYRGREIDIWLYKAMDGKKMLTGTLEKMENNNIVIKDQNGKIIEIPREKTSKVKLAVIF